MKARVARCSVAAAVLALASIAVTGCSSPQPSNTVATANDAAKVEEQNRQNSEKTVNGVAAKVLDRQITEQQVADYISQYRTYAGLLDDSDWATYIEQNGTSAEAIREDAIRFFVERYVIDTTAEEKGVSVTDDEVAEAVRTAREAYGYGLEGDDADTSWDAFLSSASYDEDSYAEDVRYSLLKNRVAALEVTSPQPSEAQVISHGNSDTESYTGKYVRIVRYARGCDGQAEATAAAISQGEGAASVEEFLDAVSEDIDSGVAENVEEGSWTCIVTPTGAANALISTLPVGKAGAYIDDDGLPAIVFVEKQYTTKRNGRLDLASMPDAIKAKMTSDAAYELRRSAMESYFGELVDKTEVTINHMPAGLPYDVDMSLSTYGVDDSVSEDEMAENAQNQVEELERLGEEQANANTNADADAPESE